MSEDPQPWGMTPKKPVPCAECRFWKNNGLNTGECRRMPPVVGPKYSGSKWPITNATDWCGESVSRKLDEFESLCQRAFYPKPVVKKPKE